MAQARAQLDNHGMWGTSVTVSPMSARAWSKTGSS